MIVYKFRADDGRYIEINFCEAGLYVEIDDYDSSDHMTSQNIMIDDEGVKTLIKYLQENGKTC
jgi:hypothetical protein